MPCSGQQSETSCTRVIGTDFDHYHWYVAKSSALNARTLGDDTIGVTSTTIDLHRQRRLADDPVTAWCSTNMATTAASWCASMNGRAGRQWSSGLRPHTEVDGAGRSDFCLSGPVVAGADVAGVVWSAGAVFWLWCSALVKATVSSAASSPRAAQALAAVAIAGPVWTALPAMVRARKTLPMVAMPKA